MPPHDLNPKVALADSQLEGTHSDKESKEYREFASQREIRKVMAALAAGSALTRRKLNEITDIEIGSLCRCLFNLCYKKMSLHVAYTARCPVTGKKVFHYAIRPKTQLE